MKIYCFNGHLIRRQRVENLKQQVVYYIYSHDVFPKETQILKITKTNCNPMLTARVGMEGVTLNTVAVCAG